ncbi:MAG: Unknown protein [uncultured Sulfurovum sp.]|uniref:ORF6C domain-containing protein n=1 Tax=uncultured Sulfurovum sp. TaxID=269237 RepID=A0A6S6S9K2_9BACT|nr:MAG: Unknown protein [uncultured Sulfurovum sp.]
MLEKIDASWIHGVEHSSGYFKDELELLTRHQAKIIRDTVNKVAVAFSKHQNNGTFDDEYFEHCSRQLYKAIRIDFKVVDYHEIERSKFDECIDLISHSFQYGEKRGT